MTSVRGQLEKREIVISIGTKRNLPITAKWYTQTSIRETPLKQALSNSDQFRRFTRNAFVISGPWKGGQWQCRFAFFTVRLTT